MINKIIINPASGLANRMRAIVSASNLAQDLNVACEILWPVDKDCHARFEDLFEKPDGVTQIRNVGKLKDLLIYDLPRRMNLRLTRYSRHLTGESVFLNDTEQVGHAFSDRDQLISILANNTGAARIRTTQKIYRANSSDYRQTFHPSAQVTNFVDLLTEKFNGNVIGLHIRRTDNEEAIAKSPTYLFIDQCDRELDEDPDIRFYLASDDETIKSEFIARYGADKSLRRRLKLGEIQ